MAVPPGVNPSGVVSVKGGGALHVDEGDRMVGIGCRVEVVAAWLRRWRVGAGVYLCSAAAEVSASDGGSMGGVGTRLAVGLGVKAFTKEKAVEEEADIVATEIDASAD